MVEIVASLFALAVIVNQRLRLRLAAITLIIAFLNVLDQAVQGLYSWSEVASGTSGWYRDNIFQVMTVMVADIIIRFMNALSIFPVLLLRVLTCWSKFLQNYCK